MSPIISHAIRKGDDLPVLSRVSLKHDVNDECRRNFIVSTTKTALDALEN